MGEQDWLAQRFEDNRTHLTAVAYRMLGSFSEADDAVQESWLRLSRSGASGVKTFRISSNIVTRAFPSLARACSS